MVEVSSLYIIHLQCTCIDVQDEVVEMKEKSELYEDLAHNIIELPLSINIYLGMLVSKNFNS